MTPPPHADRTRLVWTVGAWGVSGAESSRAPAPRPRRGGLPQPISGSLGGPSDQGPIVERLAPIPTRAVDDQLFFDLHNSYRAGRCQGYRWGDAARSTPFAAFEADVARLLLPEQRAVLLRTLRLGQKGFNLVKSGEHDRGLIERAMGLVPELERGTVARAMAETFVCANASYAHYRAGDFEAGIREAGAALRAAGELHRDHDLRCFASRRLHLSNNYARVVAQGGDVAHAVSIVVEGLRYLEGTQPTSPFLNGPEPALRADDHTYENQRILSKQLVTTLHALISASTRSRAELLGRVSPYRQESPPRPLPQVRGWLRVQAAAERGDSSEVVRLSSLFIAEGRGAYPILWHDAIAESAKCARAYGSDIADRTYKSLLGDTTLLSGYPPNLENRVQRLYAIAREW